MKSRTKFSNLNLERSKRLLLCETLEDRRVLAASVGWDGPGLGSAQLTYNIANSPSSLSSAETQAAIETALAAWASVADITFTPTNQQGRSDSIDISFSRIDGPGGTLAQAYFPDDVNPARIAGDVQFDSSEVWEVGNSLGSAAFDLVWVTVHEIGHSLGLDHLSSSAASVLAPYVSPNQAFVSLANDDIAAIQNLYAAAGETLSPVDTSTTTTVTPREPTATGDADDNPFPTHRWRRGSNWSHFGGRLVNNTPAEHNLYRATDVNNDGFTSPIDVLQIVNRLINSSIDTVNNETVWCDTNGDSIISAMDVLLVVNALNGDADGGLSNNTVVDSDDDQEADCRDDTGADWYEHRPLRSLLGPTAEQLMARFDADGDGNLIESEVPTRAWEKFTDQAVDGDEDGEVTLSELEAAMAAARANIFAELDFDSDGLLVETELDSNLWSKVSTADSDIDSSVSMEEFDVWVVEQQSNRPERGVRQETQHGRHSPSVDTVFAQFPSRIRRR